MKLSRSLEPQQLPASLKKAGLALLIFLCLFIPFRTPLSDLTFSGIKAIPDFLIVCLAAWYAVAVRFRLCQKPCGVQPDEAQPVCPFRKVIQKSNRKKE